MALRATQGTLTSTPFLLCTETRFLGGNLSQFEPTEVESLTRVFQAKASAPKRGDGEVRGTREEGTCHKRQVPLPTPHCLSTTHVRRHGEPTSPSTSYKRVQSTTSETCSKRGPTQGMGGWAMKNRLHGWHACQALSEEARRLCDSLAGNTGNSDIYSLPTLH